MTGPSVVKSTIFPQVDAGDPNGYVDVPMEPRGRPLAHGTARDSAITRRRSLWSLATSCGLAVASIGCRNELVVHARPKTLGTFPVHCALLEPWPGPRTLSVKALVEAPPCKTEPSVFIHVFHQDEKLSSRRLLEPLNPLKKEDERLSGSFHHPGSGAVVRVEVHANCEGGEHVWGEDSCRIP